MAHFDIPGTVKGLVGSDRLLYNAKEMVYMSFLAVKPIARRLRR